MISFEKVIEVYTNSDLIAQQNRHLQEVMRNILQYGYLFMTDEMNLFRKLLQKYLLMPPANMSPSERAKYIDTNIKKVQLNILLFYAEWLQVYAVRKFLNNQYLKELVMESLCIMYCSRIRGKWLFKIFDKIFKIMREAQETMVKIVLVNKPLLPSKSQPGLDQTETTENKGEFE